MCIFEYTKILNEVFGFILVFGYLKYISVVLLEMRYMIRVIIGEI